MYALARASYCGECPLRVGMEGVASVGCTNEQLSSGFSHRLRKHSEVSVNWSQRCKNRHAQQRLIVLCNTSSTTCKIDM
jgi:hypothetical protein